MDYRNLRDPNAEYTMRDLSRDSMDIRAKRGGGRDVEITDVQTTVVDGNFPWVLVRVYTDAGIVGTGEAYWGAGEAEIIDRMAPFLTGENPLDIDRLYEQLIEKMVGEGSIGGKTVSAISGIEIALHDLAGKILEVPAYQLLGGKYRDSVRVYCDCHAGDEADPASAAEEADRVVEELGFDALKFDLDVSSGHGIDRANRHLRRPEVDHKAEIVRSVTTAVGDRADVAFDCHWAFTSNSARRLARAIEELDVWWLEDPVPPENHDVQRTVTQATDTPIAAGENVYRRHGMRRLLTEEAVDIVAPDLPRVGGMRETRKIADLAELYYIPVAMHNVASPVGTMASAHAAAAIPNALAVEYHAYEVPWWDDIVGESIIQDGRIVVPEESGLGIELDMDVVAANMIQGETLFDEA